MVMREEEAKTKQCPMVNGQRPTETKCIASECMMWVNDGEITEGTGRIEQYEKSKGVYSERPELIVLATGHCGLAK
jgi:DNA/RNA endonuclease YhcR with UshA esterase domain